MEDFCKNMFNKMKNVFLIGDSIRIGKYLFGYERYLREELKNEFNVYSVKDNSRFLQYTLRYIGENGLKKIRLA